MEKHRPIVEGIHRAEWMMPVFLALVIILLGSIPYCYGYLSAPDNERFMGFVGRGTPGANGYLMMARQTRDGFHLMENKLTPEPLPRRYFNLEWWLYGKASRWTGLSLMAMFHVGRVLTVFVFCLVIYYLAALCLGSVFERRLALLLICLGSGLGWLIWCANYGLGLDLILSRDLKGVSIPGYLLNKPHFIRAGIFAVLKYAFLLVGFRSGKQRYFVLSGLSALAHSCIRPYHIPETYLVYALYPLFLNWQAKSWSWGRFKGSLIAGAVHFPAVAFYAYLAIVQTLGMSGWERRSGFLIEYVLWVGWPFLFFCLAAPYYFRLRDLKDSTLLLTLWAVLAWLICNTYPYWGAGQESSFYAFHIALPILFIGGPLRYAIGYYGRFSENWNLSLKQRRLALAIGFVLLSMPSSVLVYRSFFTQLHRPHPTWIYYLDEDTLSAIQWLEEHSDPNAVVLASHDSSQFIPRFARNKVVTGHDMLTANYDEKNHWVQQFYADSNQDAFKQELLKRFSISYVVYGPREALLGTFAPEKAPWLECVFRQGKAAVYRVVL